MLPSSAPKLSKNPPLARSSANSCFCCVAFARSDSGIGTPLAFAANISMPVSPSSVPLYPLARPIRNSSSHDKSGLICSPDSMRFGRSSCATAAKSLFANIRASTGSRLNRSSCANRSVAKRCSSNCLLRAAISAPTPVSYPSRCAAAASSALPAAALDIDSIMALFWSAMRWRVAFAIVSAKSSPDGTKSTCCAIVFGSAVALELFNGSMGFCDGAYLKLGSVMSLSII